VRDELSRQKQLTADVAHDLRTPVAGVRTLLDVCLQRQRESPEYVAAIEKARAALRQLSRLLDDVLTLSRLEAGVDQPVLADTPLEEVFAAALATVQPLAATRDVTLQSEPARGMILLTDRVRLTKILTNLLGNAVEHSPPGKPVVLSCRTQNETLELTVTDQGAGVPPAMRQRIFDRFVRGDDARTREDGHHGLGLPIAAGLARSLGGEVTLDEVRELGSRFVVTVPLRQVGSA
jgi:signal transduction histidine kinase